MFKNKKHVAILGSTGSIGKQALEIIHTHSDSFVVFLLSCNSSHELLCQQALTFKPKYVVINSEVGYFFLKDKLSNTKTIVLRGVSELCDLMQSPELDIVLTAIVGSAGLLPTVSAIKSKKTIALANKETLVVAGDLIMDLAGHYGAPIVPVDSEHSAIFQCLIGENNNTVNKLILTASGGPFLNKELSDFKTITPEIALKHPNWDMGAKITIDSATLMNKGFELIEARWLFDVSGEKINVVVHPQSIVHSLVEFVDGSVKAQLGLPKMTIPILYALFYPHRKTHPIKDFKLSKIQTLSFFEPDPSKFPHLKLAYDCLSTGGSSACSLNAANEVVVEAFLNKKISFLNMIKIIEKSLEKSIFVSNPTLDDYLQVDLETRKITHELIYKK